METIKELINQGDVNKAIEALDTLLTQSDFAGKDEVYYLRGNAYRKSRKLATSPQQLSIRY